jgi:glucans biosynthesis protein
MIRTGIILLLAVLAISGPSLAADSVWPFQKVIDKAKQASVEPFQQGPEIPDFLKNIDYDQFRDIRFKNAYTLWGQSSQPFKVRFFHPGFIYRWPVTIHYVDEAGVHLYKFSSEQFDYGKNDFKSKIPADLGFAGFRIHYPINTPAWADEIAVFLGASYFRALAPHQVYGLSARGLAINTAVDSGEEFPAFKEFWIIKPRPGDKKITVYALLDSPSVSGAYSFVIHPGKETLMQVKCVLFIRQKIVKLGIAPLTSMFFYGINSGLNFQDGLRGQVHDSDGLSILSRRGEWIWRPLINPPVLSVNTFEVGTPQGFGLFQRDEDFDHYQDLESRYDLRPSVWIVPDKDWGRGHVELVQIPSDKEVNDNINAFWVPATPPQGGQVLSFSYTLTWCSARDKLPKGYVTATRVSRQKDSPQFQIDFKGKQIDAIDSLKDITADISVTQGYVIKEKELFKNTVTGGWRLVLRITVDKRNSLKSVLPAPKSALGLRVFLKNKTRALTETWDYAYMP